MSEEQANAVSDALGGDIWLVVMHRSDGRVVALSDESVCEYENEDALHEGRAVATILLN